MIEPHGGTLVDNVVERDRYDHWLAEDAQNGPSLSLNEREYQDVLNVATGRFSPLNGFMKRDDFLKCVRDMTLEDGTVWPLPVTLDVDSEVASTLNPGDRVPLEGPNDDTVGFIDVDEVYKFNKTETARHVYGTDDTDHPGVANFLAQDDFLVGGEVCAFDDQRYSDHDLRPPESRVLFKKLGWDTVVGFQTRNAPHRGHEYIQKCALEQVDGILIQPKLGEKKSGDYADHAILGAYETLLEQYYPDDTSVLSVFPSQMRYAGPREAVFDAIVRKNQGCTHFIIGRDHAGVGDYYDGDASHEIFDTIGDIGIEPVLFEHAFYCDRCDGMASRKICPHGDDDRVYPSGTKIRGLIRDGDTPSEKMMRDEIAQYIIDAEQSFVQ